jgi:site-specific DNA recombinase
MPEIAQAALRIAIYARVSTDEQREGQTIDSQVSEVERFARDKGWPITGIYKDEGWSGGIMERPELDRLRDDAQKGVFEAVLINDVDRLARDVAHLGVIKRDLERRGIKVIFRKLPTDTSPTSNLMVNILGSFAEFERELISDRTRRGRRHKVEVRKQYLGSNTAYGYRYIPKDRVSGTEGLLEIIPEEAAVVRMMFEWLDQGGLSARRVVHRLSDLKISPKKSGARWAKSSVLRILKNEMYTGTWYYNKFQCCEPRNPSTGTRYRKRAKCSLRLRPKSEWLPLELPEALWMVPRDRWERVQQRLAQNIALSPRNEKHAYLLKGLVRCGGCGRPYVGEPGHGKFFYRCVARCKAVRTIREEALNQAVKEAVQRIILKPEMILGPLRELDAAAASDKARLDKLAIEIEREIGMIDAEEERILEAYRTEIISPAQLGQQLQKLKSRRAAVEAQRLEMQPTSSGSPEQVEAAVNDYCGEAAQNLANFTGNQWREFLRTIIETIVFCGDTITIRGKIPLGAEQPTPKFDIRTEVPIAGAARP